MRNLKKFLLGLGLAAGLTLSVASSAATITNQDGTFNFSGFDWAQGGTAYATGFLPVAGDTFTLTFFSYAVGIQDGIFTFTTPTLDTIANGVDGGYEYTIVATLTETVLGCDANSCTFLVTGGSFNILYDTTADANALAGALGTGFTDGALLISGTINPGTVSSFSLVTGSNSTTLQGVVTSTDTACGDGSCIVPALENTTATTTLQLGDAITNWVNPGGFNGVAFGPQDDPIFQADANQNFTAVPEPGILALLGLGLLGLGIARRRS